MVTALHARIAYCCTVLSPKRALSPHTLTTKHSLMHIAHRSTVAIGLSLQWLILHVF